ncbi:MAG: tetratricopeptide repeat protein [Yoonia sp.]
MQTQTFKYIVTALLMNAAIVGPVAGATLDDLFARLAEAEPGKGGRIERQISAIWENSGSPARDLLLQRGKDALEDGDAEAALDHFSALIDHTPDFAAGYNGRATAYFLLGLYGPSLDDLRQTLVLEPRHFWAMRGLAVIFENLERPSEALEVYQQVADLNPADTDVQDAIARLETELEGQAL